MTMVKELENLRAEMALQYANLDSVQRDLACKEEKYEGFAGDKPTASEVTKAWYDTIQQMFGKVAVSEASEIASRLMAALVLHRQGVRPHMTPDEATATATTLTDDIL